MKTEIKTVTPEMAQAYLTRNTRNRKLRQSVVDRYAGDMASGKWQLTHQGLAFNCDGTLLDGQHRLAAIVKAGVPVTMMMTFGVHEDAQRDMDTLEIRNPADSLSMSYGHSITNQDVALANMVFYTVKRRAFKASNSLLYDMLISLKSSMAWTAKYRNLGRTGVRSAPVWAAICLSYYYEPDLERLADFCETILGRRMAIGTEDRAAQVLRELLIASKSSTRNSDTRAEVFLKTQRAVHAFCRRESLSKILATKQYYYWPLDGSHVRE